MILRTKLSVSCHAPETETSVATPMLKPLLMRDLACKRCSKVRTKINRLQKEICNHFQKLANAHADDLARTIMSTDDTRQMFEAA